MLPFHNKCLFNYIACTSFWLMTYFIMYNMGIAILKVLYSNEIHDLHSSNKYFYILFFLVVIRLRYTHQIIISKLNNFNTLFLKSKYEIQWLLTALCFWSRPVHWVGSHFPLETGLLITSNKIHISRPP